MRVMCTATSTTSVSVVTGKYGNVPPQLQAYWVSGKPIFVLGLKSDISTFILVDVKGSEEIAMQCARR